MKQALILLFLLILIGLGLKYGRSWYKPIATKFTGAKTMASVEKVLLDKVRQRLQPDLKAAGFSGWPKDLYYVAYKEEQRLEVYGYLEDRWKLIKTYPFTAMSGRIGPKLKEGDKQIPEGLYEIEFFNPNSSYHLSMKINYPNAFDKAQAKNEGRTDIGSDIFIHGKAVSIGCIAVGDVAIEELFILSSRMAKKTHKVMILPWDFGEKREFPKVDNLPWTRQLYRELGRELSEIRLWCLKIKISVE